VRILSIVHGPLVAPGVFADVVREHGHELVRWAPPTDGPPPEDVDAVITFGGAMHVDQEPEHPWLHTEDALLRRLLADGTPVLGVCLGAQLVAKAADAAVGPARQAEIGWVPVELTGAASSDPVFRTLPARFHAFQWHSYAFAVPDDGVELARNDACAQAFRAGERAWGVQFHAEVTFEQVRAWLESNESVPFDRRALLEETRRRIAAWNGFGRALCGAFCDVGARVAAPA
jgi:GMP synthase (glutamine-hydrolysing)